MSKKFNLEKTEKVLFGAISVIWLLNQLYFTLFKPIHPMTLAPVFLAFSMIIVYLKHPLKASERFKWLRILDYVMILVLIWVIAVSFSSAERVIHRIPNIDAVLTIDKVVMAIIILSLLETVRRVLGYNLLIFVVVFIAYALFGKYAPGFTKFPGFGIEQFTEIMTLTTEGIYGTPLSTTSSFIFYFILFGSFFAACGGGQVLIDMGMKASKGDNSGPAKAAVLSSGLMGMVSGSAVANVTTTGVMTIPMMKKAGYTPVQAGAIEAVASTGGQIMPPIMGVGAFIMAELLGVKYGDIAKSAAIPAIAYFGSIFLLVTFIGRKNNYYNTTTSEELTFEVDRIVPRLYLLLPAVYLIYQVMTGQSLRTAALLSITLILVLNLVPKYRVGFKELYDAFTEGIVQAAHIALPTAACGVIIGIVIQSGLANKFSNVIAVVGGSSLLAALLITTLGCMLLGMALPTVAAYLIAVVLFVPVLIRLEVPILVAHMFCFYFGVMAQITPPVCLASFTAAGIAGADSWETGWEGFKYALVAFIVPFVFVYQPAILLQGELIDTLLSTASLFVGVYALAGALAGFMFSPVRKLERLFLFAIALLLIVPETITDIIGFSALVLFIIMNRRKAKVQVDTVEQGS
jgi:TRAP transporter 4TM/12TM fusion protein